MNLETVLLFAICREASKLLILPRYHLGKETWEGRLRKTLYLRRLSRLKLSSVSTFVSVVLF